MASSYAPLEAAGSLALAPVTPVTDPVTRVTSVARMAHLLVGRGRDGARPWVFTATFWAGLLLPFTGIGPSPGEPVGAVLVGLGLLAVWPLLPWERGSRSPGTWWFLGATVAFFATAGVGYAYLVQFVALGQLVMTWGRRWGAVLCAGLSLYIGVGVAVVHGGTIADAFGQFLGAAALLGFVLFMADLAARERSERRRVLALLDELAAAHAELGRRAEQARELAVAQERARLAREVHDAAGHHLTVVKLDLANALRLRDVDPDAAWACVADARDGASRALDEVRRAVRALGPAQLAGGLEQALAGLVASYGHGPLAVDLAVEGERVALAPVVRATVYRVVEEALTNAHRHAVAATRAEVRVGVGPDAVVVAVTDDGRATSEPVPGFGLGGLRERLDAVGGTLHVGRAASGGVVVRARVPLGAIA